MECEKHPGQDTMVPCLGCGRSFCRICDPPKGAGQYCPVCYREQLERLAGKEEKPAAAGKAAAKGSKGVRAKIRGRKADAAAAEIIAEKPKRSLRQKLLVPVDWIEDTALAAGRKIASAGKYIGRLPVRAGKFIARTGGATAQGARDHFPVGLASRELLEGDPPFRAAWVKLLAFVLGGAFLWVVAVALAQTRNPGISLCVSAIVAAGVVWAMGSKYGIKVAIIAAGLALVSLMFAELTVQLMYRAGFIIKKLDLQLTGLYQLGRPSAFYRAFAFKLIVYRLAPGAIVAFLIGWWPLKMRLTWVGFKSRVPRAIRAARARERREGARVKPGYRKVAQGKESSKG